MEAGLVIGVIDAALTLQEARAKVAAANIALANTPNARAASIDINSPFALLRSELGDSAQLQRDLETLKGTPTDDLISYSDVGTNLPLDAAVGEVSAASGKYQGLAEGLSRQYALMQIAIGGNR